MSIQYSGGTLVNTTFTSDGTRAQLLTQLAAALTAAGWSTVSGGGTSDILMKTAVTPQGLSVRFRLYDPAANNCIQITMKNAAGTASGIGYMLPTNGRVFRIVANKYQFFMFASGAVYRTAARNIAMGGTLVGLPANILASLGSDLEVGWFQWNGDTDTSVAANITMRSEMGQSSGTLIPWFAASLWTSYLLTYTTWTQTQPTLISVMFSNRGVWVAGTWNDGSLMQLDALMGWSSTSAVTGAWAYKGFLSDAFLLVGSVHGETDIATFDGHTWLPITDQTSFFGTLYVAVT